MILPRTVKSRHQFKGCLIVAGYMTLKRVLIVSFLQIIVNDTEPIITISVCLQLSLKTILLQGLGAIIPGVNSTVTLCPQKPKGAFK